MKYKLYYIIGASMVLLVSNVCCKKFVQIEQPTDRIATKTVFGDNNIATSALTSIYLNMASNGESYLMAFNMGLMSDELTNSLSTDPQVVPYYQDALSQAWKVNPSLSKPWTSAYPYIYQANAVIEGLKNNNAIVPTIAKQLTAEAKFIRAFWLSYLVASYGDVPLTTTTDYTVNVTLPRASKTQVYTQIIADLVNAQDELNLNYVDASDTTATIDKVRPNKNVAAALLARVYLYDGKYDSAELETNLVLSSSAYTLSNLSDVFLANSSEAIWQLFEPAPQIQGEETYDGYNFILQTAPNQFGNFNVAQISPWLMSTFEAGDNRKNTWIDSISFDSNIYYFPYKYQVHDIGNNPNSRTERTMVLRLAEQYLIRAEARAQQSELEGAVADLNTIRHRAGLGDYAGSLQKDSLLLAILHERQVELFTEWGHRWLDLGRTGNINSVMGVPMNICAQKGGSWDPNWTLLPVPYSEIKTDIHLTQNPGYN